MKKIFIFLLAIMIGATCTNVKAETFYEGEYIDGIYTKSIEKNGNGKYQKARFFRRASDNKEAYCIEPFATFNNTANYLNVNYGRDIDPNTWNKMALIAHYGYGYNNHTDKKWYAVAQLMIWRLAVPNADFYFTDTLNGTRTNNYEAEINEINNLVNNFETLPNISYVNTSIVGKDLVLEDSNHVLNNYKIENTYGEKIRIENNKLIYENIKEGTTSIILTRNLENEPTAALLYYTNNSQNLLVKGNIGQKRLEIKITGTSNEIKITKIDKDTNSTIPSGEGILKNAVYGLYDINDNQIQEITFDEKSTATIKNLDYGNYYLKEIKPGIGYTLNKDKITFSINQNTTTIDIKLTNKIIEKEITIHKEYGTKENIIPEEGISFNIYDKNNNLIDTITTDKEGNAKIKLPYGKYKVKQQNSSYGYSKIEDFEIEINDKETNNYFYKLYDYQIQKEITIHKEYGTKDNTIPEEGISFDIYDSNNNLIDTITTDKEGNAKIKLPYGKYKVKQRNTNTGYTKVKDFEIEVTEEEKEYEYKLYDYKIPIPNTGIKESNSYLLFLLLIPLLYFYKKKNVF